MARNYTVIADDAVLITPSDSGDIAPPPQALWVTVASDNLQVVNPNF